MKIKFMHKLMMIKDGGLSKKKKRSIREITCRAVPRDFNFAICWRWKRGHGWTFKIECVSYCSVPMVNEEISVLGRSGKLSYNRSFVTL